MDQECNIFSYYKDMDCSHVVKITSVLNSIKNGRWKDVILKIREAKANKNKSEVDRLKLTIPAVTWSGVFEEREDDACVHYNKLIVLDIDVISDSRLEKLKIELLDNPWIYAFFDGPSKGIKVLVFISSEIEWHSSHCFIHLESAFMELYGIQLDKSGKNPSRLCFVSYDPKLYINPNPEELQIEKYEGKESFMTLNKGDFENAQPSTNGKYILDTCIKMVKKSKTGSYYKGNRNNFIFRVGCLSCQFGVSPELALTLIFSRYPSLGYPEIKNTVQSAYKRNKNEFATKVVHEKRNKNQQDLL